MKKLAILSACIAAMFATAGYAQTTPPRGEADASGTKAVPAKPATKEEKAAAAKERKAAGAAHVKAQAANEEPRTTPAAETKKVSKEEKVAAKAARKASGTEARKQGSSVQ